MSQDRPSNMAASVRGRLLNIIRETGDDANMVWTRYATERLLYRLSISEYALDFILKGAMLCGEWGQIFIRALHSVHPHPYSPPSKGEGIV